MLFPTSEQLPGTYVTPDRLTDRELRLQYAHTYYDLWHALRDLKYAVVGRYGQPMSEDAVRAWERLNALADEIRRRKHG